MNPPRPCWETLGTKALGNPHEPSGNLVGASYCGNRWELWNPVQRRRCALKPLGYPRYKFGTFFGYPYFFTVNPSRGAVHVHVQLQSLHRSSSTLQNLPCGFVEVGSSFMFSVA